MDMAGSVLLAYLVSLIPVRSNDQIIIKNLYFYEGIKNETFKSEFKIIIIVLIIMS